LGGNRDVLPLRADITQPTQVADMVGQAVARFGGLDMLVNCAGVSARGSIQGTSLDEFRRLMELNFFATVDCTQAALPHLLARRGHVVNIGSLASKCAAPYMGGYASSKFAVAAFSQQLRLETASQGLHVLLVCPGPIARDQPREYAAGEDLPASAHKPGAGAKLKGINPNRLADKIVQACQRRRPELVVPGKARLLFALSQWSPSWGDWLLRRMTGSDD
jgi:short-subunit dehydrogenase